MTSPRNKELNEYEPAEVVPVIMTDQNKARRRFRKINQNKYLYQLRKQISSLRLSQMESLVDQDPVRSAQTDSMKMALKIDQLFLSHVLKMETSSHRLHQTKIQGNQALIENATSRSN